MPYSNNPRATAKEIETDFQNYTELPNNNPLVIVDSGMKIAYCNDIFKNTFGLGIKDDIQKMNSNPEFVYLLRGFSESRYKNITLDINLSSDNDKFIQNYSVSIERIKIRASQYFVLTIESLEQRKKLENKINSLHNALDHGNVPIIIVDSSRKVTYATRSFEELLSKEIDGIYNQDLCEILSDIFDREEIENLNYALVNFLAWKRMVSLLKKNAVQFWEFAINPVITGEDPKPNYILIANNLTEHINQTKAIERSERKQRLIIDNISDLLLIVERSGAAALFENANDNFCSIFGLDKNKIHSFKIDDFIPAELVDLIYSSIKYLSQQKIPYHEFNYKHTDKREYSCKITDIVEHGHNSTIYIVTMKDITDEVHYREQLKKAYHKEMQLNKMKSDFLANMSHEIRTPFNAVVGFSEIVDESIETGDIEMLRELMDSMKEVLGRALNLFTNIVEVSLIEAGEVELDKVDLNCNQVVRNVYQQMAAEAAKKKLEFILSIAEEECLIEIDWVKLEKIIHSLVDNAIKYTTEGYIYLGTKHFGDKIEITISDTGVGIEQAQIERLLKPFTQEVEGYTRPFEGAGLGLTIAYRLTELMNGDFQITSQKNKGTKISLTFPLSK
ncbi:MAG: ATP-binding protein [Bacteroidota bacterium]